ncbi:hypothetical protein F3Y22_tig00110733pilonHSYRG00274 [Hibiscus syriacus]|uniref:Uncharacterized protein n=1 Tax=Hibiscus syriacus TaxID=106335 RepID=A0A6A2ZWA9_HIBSY|nr:hypothetical protein F3Y22_tig00110733pilonHSYRG00274 [Hibiscus syriacus]
MSVGQWRNKAHMSTRRIQSEMPVGHVTVYVETRCKRFVVRLTYLNHPVFKKLHIKSRESTALVTKARCQSPATSPSLKK